MTGMRMTNKSKTGPARILWLYALTNPFSINLRYNRAGEFLPLKAEKKADAIDSLTILLKLVEPGCPTEAKVETLRGLDPQSQKALIAEAERQGVTLFLYAMLARLEREHRLGFPHRDKLYQRYVINAGRNTLILHDTEILLSTLKDAGVSVAGLKGVYLLENVYGNIGARPMNDIDLLVRKSELAACLDVLRKLGYVHTAYFSIEDENIDTKHIPPMRKAGGALLEVHWTLLEEHEPFTIDADALWERTMPAKIANIDTLALGVEDLILHLCMHLTYQHYLQLGLRGLLDIALAIDKFAAEIDWEKLTRIAKSWGAERVTALSLKLAETQLKVPVPPGVFFSLAPGGIEPSMLEGARALLLERVTMEHRLTPDLVNLQASRSIFTKMKIGLQRVFIPRLALARIYNVAPDSPRVLGLYWKRLKYLIRNYGDTLKKLSRDKEAAMPFIEKAQSSYSLHDWMSGNNH